MALRIPLPFDRAEPGFWVSGLAHAAILGAALLAFTSQSFPEAQEGIPVEMMTEAQVSEIMKGEKSASAPQPKPRADRAAEREEERDPGEAKQDVPSPPERPPEMKTAEAEWSPPPTPPLRPTLEQPTPAPAAPSREEQVRKEAAKEAAREAAKEAARQEAAKQEAAKEAVRQEAERKERVREAAQKAEAHRREELAKLVERQEAEAEAQAQAKAEAEAKARAEAKRVADAKAREDKARAERARADAEARAELDRKVAEAQARADAETKAKAEAEAKAKADAKAEAKRVAEAKARSDKAKADAEARAKAKAELAAKFNAGDIQALLATRQPAQSMGATAREVQRVASLGSEVGAAQRMNPSQRDALIGLLQSQIERCYAAPPGAASGIVLPVLDIRLNPDGSFAADPRIMRGGASSIDTSIAQAALRAVRRCAPYRIPAQYAPYYNDWKIINATFDLPRG